jgi:TonB family protein
MTLTIKEPPDLTSPAKPGSPSQKSENSSGQSARSNPVCLEVPVTIRRLPGEHGNDPGAAGPVREEGRTVIVFDNGAVLRLANALPAGQTVILSNQQGRDVVCRVSAGRNLPNIKGYLEVEFIEPVNDFWHVHQNAEPASAPPVVIPLVAAPQIQTAPALPVPVPAAPTRAAAPEAEPSSGNAPSFEDIAGLVRMSPAAVIREKKIDPAPLSSAIKSKDESSYRQPEIVSPISSPSAGTSVETGAVPSLSGSLSVKSENSASQEAPPVPVRTPSFSTDLTSKGTLASTHDSPVSSSSFSSLASSTSGESRGRMPMIVGGVALVLLGFGGGYFLMHRGGSTPEPAAIMQPSAPPPVVGTSAPDIPLPPDIQQVPQQAAQPISAAVPVSDATKAPPVSDLPKAQKQASIVDSKEPERTSARGPAIPNLKMSSPTSPRRDPGKLSEAPSIGEPDLTVAAAPGGAPPAALMPSVARSESQPAPPPSAAPRVFTGRSATDPTLISSTHPTYPDMAKQAKVQGNVVVSFTVDPKGNVIDAKVVSGPTLLREAALEAVKKWRYSPAILDGKPTPAQLTVNVNFRMN